MRVYKYEISSSNLIDFRNGVYTTNIIWDLKKEAQVYNLLGLHVSRHGSCMIIGGSYKYCRELVKNSLVVEFHDSNVLVFDRNDRKRGFWLSLRSSHNNRSVNH